MNQNFFINEAIHNGIFNYINKTNEEEYITKIIMILISIYGELDIINPYKTNTEKSFDENLTKFGYSQEKLSLFKQNVMDFYLTKEVKPNKYFNKIQMELVDMFFLKAQSLNKDLFDDTNFIKNLQLEGTKLNSLYSINPKEIKKYYQFKKKQFDSNLNFKKIEKQLLIEDAYHMLGYSYEKISNMNETQLLDINNKVFAYFKIDPSKEDKYLRLEQAILYYKDFPDESLKNGYVEFLLLSGFIAVSLLVILVVVGVLIR